MHGRSVAVTSTLVAEPEGPAEIGSWVRQNSLGIFLSPGLLPLS